MDDPDVIGELYRVNHSVRVTAKRQRDLEYALTQALEGLRIIGLAALCRDRERRKTD